MRIKEIQISKVDLALTRPYEIAYKKVTSVDNVILKLILENGITGWGACNPSKYVVGVDNEDVITYLTEEKYAIFIGKDIRQFHFLLDLVYKEFAGNTGAKVLFDIAIHDAFTQYLGIPLGAFYGLKHHAMRTSVTIGIMGIEETLKEARDFIQSGFNCLKVKLGKSLLEDIERLKALRKEFGPGISIRIDANQGWTVEDTIAFFKLTEDLDIELVEQPVKADQIEQLNVLAFGLKSKIAADESLIDVRDAKRLSEGVIPAGIFNIKLMKCGGIREGLRMADIALEHNIDLMWGCNDESIISISAALHAAFSCANTKYLDLDGSFDLAIDVVQGGFYLKEGMLSLTGENGLGVRLLQD